MGLLISQLEEVLASSPEVDEDLLEIRGLNINSLACLVAHSSAGIKCSVPTLEELELLVKTLVHMTVGACGKWK
jgi:serine kinase of HPr protein (carbohydrate metabolism regulator)